MSEIRLIQPSVAIPSTGEDDPRVGQLIHRGDPGEYLPRIVLVGFPSDEGVRRNGGRVGASRGPSAIRRQLYKLTPHPEYHQAFVSLLDDCWDLGDLQLSDDVESNQQNLGRLLASYLSQGVIPIILGGGHETAFGHFLGYVEAEAGVSIFNLDAHTDVRELKEGQAHSGSPFRQAIEHKSGLCRTYAVAGLQPSSVSREHLEYIDRRGGLAMFKSATTQDSIGLMLNELNTSSLMCTFDLDAVQQAYAPGVSAPAPNGIQAELWLKTAYLAGKHPAATSFDVVELNPAYDRDEQTAKLAALTIWNIMLGLVNR